ncbi:MAG: di-heme oxidoredictase family protein [Cyanobacteria bacterium J06636_16]
MPKFPGLGNQIQDFAIYGQNAEAEIKILWRETAGTYGDGEPYRLRQPQFDIRLENGEVLSDSALISPRIPPQVYGLGLLEAIEEADLLALADPEDVDRDGISGKPNNVLNVETETLELGRFGWEAGMPNLLQQSAAAYVDDIGITNPLYPAEDGSAEIDQETLVAAAAYAQTLAVPVRVMVDDPEVQRGEQLFSEANCASCHATAFQTGMHKYPSMRNQLIAPYTDLLLHDMGEGLADGRPEFLADGQEWRTPALWGIGLAQTVLPYSGYLHDGQARTLEEAILWHGGEAEQSKEVFRTLEKSDREALVRFLKSI